MQSNALSSEPVTISAAEVESSNDGKGVSFGMMTIFLVGEYFWRRKEEFDRPKIRKRAKS